VVEDRIPASPLVERLTVDFGVEQISHGPITAKSTFRSIVNLTNP
jgi:hypothetical protein